MNSLKNFYEKLFTEKGKADYKKQYDLRKKDFFHKYFLFFLNPDKNSRHEIVKKILSSGNRYLDIGCWSGDAIIIYDAFKKYNEVYGIDISESAVKKAKEKGIKASFVDINSEKLPFTDNFFDTITFIDVIEHLIDPYLILAEIKRVLKPEGTLIIGTANVSSLSNRLRILFGRRPRTSFDNGWDGGHLLYFTPKELKKLLEGFNFKILKKFATGNLQIIRKIFFSMTGEFIFKCILNK